MNQETGTGKYDRLLERCRCLDLIPTAVAHPCEATALAGAVEAAQRGLILNSRGRPSQRSTAARKLMMRPSLISYRGHRPICCWHLKAVAPLGA